ncbi:MAG TPA: PAS domain S-box protein [Chthoniobacteraceae bacterium]|nr:PAS domain S-box protein [Chthoniobacteraceae bacterium]
MSWVTVIWSMIASACLTLAGLHVLVWCRRRAPWGNLFFSLAAVGTAGMAMCELWMMRAETPTEWSVVARWIHVPVWMLVVSLVGFVRVYLRAGRPWLGWTICGVRTLALALNFVFTPLLNYREVTGLGHISFLGESVAFGEGVPNPWMLLGQLSLLLLVVFVVDATVVAWRRGEHRPAIQIGCNMVFFVVMATAQTMLVLWGILHTPVTPSVFFLGIVAAMGFELSNNVLRAAQLADELRESEARFRIVADTAPVMIWMSGPDKLGNFFNKGWLDFTGRTPEQEMGNGWAEGLHPDDFERCLKTYTTAFDAREPFSMEYRLRKPDGEYGWVLDTGVPRMAGDGAFLGYIGTAIDITAKKQAEERFRLVVEAASNAMVMLDSRGAIVLANAQAEAVFGYTRAELIGQFLDKLVPERSQAHRSIDHDGYVADPATRAIGAERELFGKRKDGTEVPVEIGLNPIRTPEGLFVLASIVDITERKQAELEAVRHRTELAHLSRVAMLGELSGSLAHELNQPLTAILSNAQAAQRYLAKDNPNLAEVREILADIVTGDERAGEVIQRLRLLLKKGEIQHQLLDANEVVRDVLKLMRSDLANHGVSVEAALTPGLAQVRGDRVQLQQVVLNLALNACDAMAGNEQRDRLLTVRTLPADGARLRIEVIDVGHGLPNGGEDLAFERFFTTKPRGLGLGLSVCRTIVTAHGGTLGAANNAGRGATFHCTLPLVREVRT